MAANVSDVVIFTSAMGSHKLNGYVFTFCSILIGSLIGNAVRLCLYILVCFDLIC